MRMAPTRGQVSDNPLLSVANDCCAALAFDYQDAISGTCRRALLLQHGGARTCVSQVSRMSRREFGTPNQLLTVTMAKALGGRVRYVRRAAEVRPTLGVL